MLPRRPAPVQSGLAPGAGECTVNWISTMPPVPSRPVVPTAVHAGRGPSENSRQTRAMISICSIRVPVKSGPSQTWKLLIRATSFIVAPAAVRVRFSWVSVRRTCASKATRSVPSPSPRNTIAPET